MQAMAKIKRNPAAQSIADQILENYNPESVEDMQEALRDIFGPMFEGLLKGELNHHLGYESNSKEPKDTDRRQSDLHVCQGHVTKRHLLYDRRDLWLFCIPRDDKRYHRYDLTGSGGMAKQASSEVLSLHVCRLHVCHRKK